MMNPSISIQPQIYSNPHGKRPLSPSFQPGPYDVICARGKQAHSHEGNKRFRELVKLHQTTYSAASTKYQKSQIVSHITNIVRQSSPEGGFVKIYNGVWHEVGDRAAKEKIGQTMRDLLHTKYSSSTKAKARVRIQKRVDEYQQEEQQKQQAQQQQAVAAAPQPILSSSSTSSNMPPLKEVQFVVDDIKSNCGVSVVSNDDYREDNSNSRPAAVPSHIQVPTPETSSTSSATSKTHSPATGNRPLGMFIPTAESHGPNEPSGEALLDALFENDTEPLSFEPLPLNASSVPIVEFHDSDLEDSMKQTDLLDFCNVMGVAC